MFYVFWFKIWIVGVVLQLLFVIVSKEAERFDWVDKLLCVVLWPVTFFVSTLRALRELLVNVIHYPISNYVSFFYGLKIFSYNTIETKAEGKRRDDTKQKQEERREENFHKRMEALKVPKLNTPEWIKEYPERMDGKE